MPIAAEKEGVVFNVRYAAKYKVAKGEKKELLDKCLGIEFNKMLIVGFLADKDKSRSTVYWLAFRFED